MSRVLDFVKRKEVIIDKLEYILIDGAHDILLNEIEDLLNETISEIENKEEDIEQLNEYIENVMDRRF